MMDIVPAIAEAKEAVFNVNDILTRHFAWMQQTSNHQLQEQSPIKQLQGKNSLPY